MLSLTADQYLEAEAQKKDLGPAKDSFKRLYKELETGLIPFIEPFVSSTRIFPAYLAFPSFFKLETYTPGRARARKYH